MFFLSIAIHEFAHAFSAAKLGDDTAKKQGRLTLNPFKHADLVGNIHYAYSRVYFWFCP
jgi:Zn-dependent protease